jgi:hypothetical protein
LKHEESNDLNKHINLDKEGSKVRLILEQLSCVLTTTNHNEGYYWHKEPDFLVRNKTKKQNVKDCVVGNIGNFVESFLVTDVSKN